MFDMGDHHLMVGAVQASGCNEETRALSFFAAATNGFSVRQSAESYRHGV